MRLEQTEFGKTKQGEAISLYTLANDRGTILKMTDFGAILVAFEIADRNGISANINLGFDHLDDYLSGHPFFGATVGRYCNRIAKGSFSLEDKTYSLATNNGPNHLHGGITGFDKHVWQAEPVQNADGVGLRFTRTSPDGEEGYPGTMDVAALYFLANDDSLRIEFTATTDHPTPINLTNHCYWNLAGAHTGSVHEHQVMIAADQYLEVDEGSIPTGVTAVTNTPFDFTTMKPIGRDIAATPGGEKNGYDHCFVLRSQSGELSLAARVEEPQSGRVMEIYTTQPGVQFYTANNLDGSQGFERHGAFCLETQHYPDSPNQPQFPTSILKPGERFSHTTLHRFTTV